MSWNPPATIEELEAPLRKNIEAWDSATAFSFTIELQATGAFLGRIVIRQQEECGVWDLGYWTHPEHQGQGYMSEAGAAIVEFGFRNLGAKRLEARYAEWNWKSGRVLNRIGMEFVRRIPDGFQKNGQVADDILMAIQRSEWQTS